MRRRRHHRRRTARSGRRGGGSVAGVGVDGEDLVDQAGQARQASHDVPEGPQLGGDDRPGRSEVVDRTGHGGPVVEPQRIGRRRRQPQAGAGPAANATRDRQWPDEHDPRAEDDLEGGHTGRPGPRREGAAPLTGVPHRDPDGEIGRHGLPRRWQLGNELGGETRNRLDHTAHAVRAMEPDDDGRRLPGGLGGGGRGRSRSRGRGRGPGGTTQRRLVGPCHPFPCRRHGQPCHLLCPQYAGERCLRT